MVLMYKLSISLDYLADNLSPQTITYTNFLDAAILLLPKPPALFVVACRMSNQL